MAIFKRFEVWLLLVLSIAGVGYVLWSENQPDSDEAGGSGTAAADPGDTEETKRFEIREVRTIAEGENQVIEIELLGRNDQGEPEALAPAEARLLAKYEGEEKEMELPTFFLPFNPPPTLAPNSETIVTLKYWLEPRSGKPNPPLTLRMGDESFTIMWAEDAYRVFTLGDQF